MAHWHYSQKVITISLLSALLWLATRRSAPPPFPPSFYPSRFPIQHTFFSTENIQTRSPLNHFQKKNITLLNDVYLLFPFYPTSFATCFMSIFVVCFLFCLFMIIPSLFLR
ncbi:hypothetical protein BDB00DRAFT_206629 [Zychaea mexicana]|uniref:uncharacterized protein n=1 Tax=Zychaea mexicana TaxID=64656 RepID=UPI0022FE2B5B|nr:uncharacterized protein BDB00DRAFT_206629 [Zychaea mexicana]KAI9495603.1 hypothetical protein BDB00DRAFT_206629 [Zychaea mexicana]